MCFGSGKRIEHAKDRENGKRIEHAKYRESGKRMEHDKDRVQFLTFRHCNAD